MKCKHCGSNLTIDARYCAYCGNENPYFKKHREEMQEYHDEYLDTKEEVLQDTRKFKHITIKATIIAILVACNLLVVVFELNLYEITKWVDGMYVSSHYSELIEQLDELEATENFEDINYMYSEYNLYRYDEFDSYSELFSTTSAYSWVYSYLIDWDDKLEYVNKYDEDINDYVENLASSVNFLAGFGIQSTYDDPDAFSDVHMASINKMKENALVLIKQNFDLDQEDITNFWDLSNLEREVALSNGVKTYEE